MSRASLVAGALVALALAPAPARAGEPRSATCSVNVTYLVNNTVRSTYLKDFSVAPGAPFSDDFSTATRFRYFDSSAQLDADGRALTVTMSYYNDVGVFEFVDLRSEVKVRDDRQAQTATGTSTYWSSLGIAGEHTTRWTLTCQVPKD